MRLTKIPNAAMKLLPNAGGFDLVLKHPADQQMIVVAHVPHTAGEDGEAWAMALSAAFVAYHALEQLIEYVQPDGWDMTMEEGRPWRMALRANCIANGAAIPQMYAEY